MGGLLQDVRYGIRSLASSPGITAVAVATLALGIGATTSIFSVADAVLFRPLPYPDPDRLVRIYTTDSSRDEYRGPASGANFLDWKAQGRSFEHLAAFDSVTVNLVGGEYPRRVWGASVTPDFFSVMGVDPILGRTLSPDIDGPDASPTVVLSHDFWQSDFEGDPSVLGRELKLSGVTYTVVGVMPPGFGFPGRTPLWLASRYRVPDPPYPGTDPAEERGHYYFSVVGRLGEGIGLGEAQAEMSTIAERLAQSHPDTNTSKGIRLVSLRESIVTEARPVLSVFLGAVGFLLLIACANAANLLLVRASRREREIAIRTALGAGRLRIVRQLLVEGILLALCGGLLGVLVSLWGAETLIAISPEAIPRAHEVGVDLRVLAFTLVVSLLTGALFGIAPALQLGRQDVQAALKEGGTAQSASRARARLRAALIVGEVAVSLLLLLGAALLMRTFLTLNGVEPGFNPAGTLAANVSIPPAKYSEDPQIAAFYRNVLDRLRSLPGVTSAGAVFSLPLRPMISASQDITVEGRPTEPGKRLLPGYQLASHDYFRTLGIPLVRGRHFTEADVENAPPVALVNEKLAGLYWPGEDPIGRRITWDDPADGEVEWATIVGIVGNTTLYGLAEGPTPEIYRPYRQAPLPWMTLVVRSDRDPADLASAVRTSVMEVDPEQPITGVMTMEKVVSSSLDQRRFNMQLLGAFALSALTLAAIGLYGVLSFSVSQRSREIGIRKALGAQTKTVVAHVVREGLRLAVAGLAIGALGGLGLTRFISGLVHGVSPVDPVSYLLAALLLTGMALLACYIPALRAARVDPAVSLRHE